MEGSYKNRYDVTLLINGLPLVHIELKRRGIEMKEAFNQICRYKRHSFWSGMALFQYVQIFVISNGVNTKYFSNNRIQALSRKQTFYWTDAANKRQTNILNGFTSDFLEPCHISKMISKYIVLNETHKILMVLRPYQFYAVEALVNKVVVSHGRANLQANNENSHLEPVRYGKGSGFWRMLMLPMVSEKHFFKRLFKFIITPLKAPLSWLKVFFVNDFGKRTSLLLFMQHLDSTLSLKKGFFGVQSSVGDGKSPTAFIPEAHKIANQYSKIINAKPMVVANETITGIPSTAHVLDGAAMGKNAEEGVIDKDNKVFGYKNMYVFDGSMISANPGVNPSLSIAAIAERGMSRIEGKEM